MQISEENKLFMDVIHYIIDNGMADNYGDIAKRANLGPNTISRIKNGHVTVGDDTIRKIGDAFAMINIDYMRGRSRNISKSDDTECKTTMVPPSTLDMSFVFERIEASKNETIAALQGRISDLEATIRDKERIIAMLENAQRGAKLDNEYIAQMSNFASEPAPSNND